jgi:hypothetical protein
LLSRSTNVNVQAPDEEVGAEFETSGRRLSVNKIPPRHARGTCRGVLDSA